MAYEQGISSRVSPVKHVSHFDRGWKPAAGVQRTCPENELWVTLAFMQRGGNRDMPILREC